MLRNGIRKSITFLRDPGPLAFCVRFVLVLGVVSLASVLAWNTAPFESLVHTPLNRINAWLAHVTLRALGVTSHLSGTFVVSREFSIEIVPACTGLFNYFFLFAAVLAFPAPWRARIRGFGLGAALIFLLNLIRIVSLFFVGASYPDLFKDLHYYVWPGILIIAVCFFLYAWAYRSLTVVEPSEA
jgi:exosortase family protein XrtM